MDGIENAEDETLAAESTQLKCGEESTNSKSFERQKPVMNPANLQSTSTSESVPTFPPSTYSEVYKAYRPKFQKQESLPLRGISSSSVNTSQSMPFNQPKLSNGKIEYISAEGMQTLKLSYNEKNFLNTIIT